LIYAFGGFTKDNQLKPFDKYQDIEQGGYAKFTGLKTYNKELKTMLAIGGWNEGSSRFSPLVASPDRRAQLVKNSIKFLRQNKFDGLDLDWGESPSQRQQSSESESCYSNLPPLTNTQQNTPPLEMVAKLKTEKTMRSSYRNCVKNLIVNTPKRVARAYC